MVIVNVQEAKPQLARLLTLVEADLPLHHRDPFDRVLVVQARHERVPILTADPKLATHDVEILW